MRFKALGGAKHSPGTAGLKIARHKDGCTFPIEAFLERLKSELRQKLIFEGIALLSPCPARP
jgi:hypothetical protein